LPSSLHDTPTTFLAHLFAEADHISFIQIGAFDGLAGDPISDIVRTGARWRGVLVEPQPNVFARLQANYAGHHDRLAFAQCAVSDAESSRPFYFIREEEVRRRDLPGWAAEVASFDIDHVRRHFPDIPIASLETPVRTVAGLAQDAGFAQVDLIVMDVEGHERTIIESVDWLGLGVRACLFEHKHMAPEDLAAVEAVFTARGFALRPYGRDTIAWRGA
jgi:FkbM family methyltransferase